ncbi:MAG: nuclear transport factor 2 family protein [Gemmataceae bacterium]|nr:nuclear transport factor 2 family protein [Gemmataceae bacterium]MCI0741407.1 nuclear transport factor 2 family protein [Gemmataceae bacterium]
MKQRWIVALVFLIGIGGWAIAQREQPKADVKTQLLDADRAFAKTAAEKGLEGWLSFMTDDAVRISPLGGKAHVGKAAIKELDAALFADAKRLLTWEPADGGAFADGKHGFTTGKFKILSKPAEGKEEVVRTGAYVTWWRMGEDGRWKVILDTGSVDPPKP